MIWNDIKDVETIIKHIERICPNAILLEGYNDCIIGIHLAKPNNTHVVYSQYGIVKKLMTIDDGMDYLTALDYFDVILRQVFELDNNTMPIFKQDLPTLI